MKKVIYTLSSILLISLILVSSYFVFLELIQNENQENTFEELIEVVKENSNGDIKKEMNLEELYAINNDLIGWIKISGTNIDYPVMQSKKNPNYYLNRDFYKKYSSYGVPYMSENCNIYDSDNIVIYGHNIKNGKMFGGLEKYKSKEFYENHKIIELSTLNGKEQYEIFAVLKTVAYSEKGFKYYQYTKFSNEENFNAFIGKCKELSILKTNMTPEYGSKLITLSTCAYHAENGRLVIIASRVDN